MVEGFAPIVALDALREYISGRRLILLVDSEAVEGTLVRGYSSREDLCELAGLFWSLASDLDVEVYIDRVPTDGNPSDGPSRGDAGELEERGSIPCVSPPASQLLSRSSWTSCR